MEGGQKVPISLEAGLDISSSDMLVPFSQLTFQHNWQKWQGKCLPNSLRFEHDGWAAGWNVYDFDYKTFIERYPDHFVSAEKLSSDMYMLSVYDNADVEMLKPLKDWRVVTDNKILSGAARLQDGNIVGTIDSPNGRVNYSLTWDSNARKFNDLPAGAQFKLKKFDVKDGIVYVTVKDTAHSYAGKFKLFTAAPLASEYSQGYTYTGYSTDNGEGVHTWDGYKYNINTHVLTSPAGTQLTLTPVVDFTGANEDNGHSLKFSYIDIVEDNIDTFKGFLDYDDERNTVDEADRLFDDNSQFIGESYDIAYSIERYYKAFNGLSATNKSDSKSNILSADANSKLVINKYNLAVSSATGSLSPSEKVLIDLKVPIWWILAYDVRNDRYKVYHHGIDRTSSYNIDVNDNPLMFLERIEKVGEANPVSPAQYTGDYTPWAVDDINNDIYSQAYNPERLNGNSIKDYANVGDKFNDMLLRFFLKCPVPVPYNGHVKVTPKPNMLSIPVPEKAWLNSMEAWYVKPVDVPSMQDIGTCTASYTYSGPHGSGSGTVDDCPLDFKGYRYEGRGAYAVFNDCVETRKLNGTFTDGGQVSMVKDAAAGNVVNKSLLAGYVYGELNNKTNDRPVIAASAVLEGHALFVLEYSKISNESAILNDSSILRVRPATEKDSEFTSFLQQHSNERIIMVDRDSINVSGSSFIGINTSEFRCERLFSFKVSGKLIDDRNGDGYITISPKIIGSNRTGLLYGVANDTDTDVTDASEAVEPVDYSFYIPPIGMQPFTNFAVSDRYPNGVPNGINADQGATSGHVSYASDIGIRVHWTPEFDEGPVSMDAVLKVRNRLGYKHDIYTKKLIELQNARCSIKSYKAGSGVSDYGVIPIEIEIQRHDLDANSNESRFFVIKAEYDCEHGKLSNNIVYCDRVRSVVNGQAQDSDTNITDGNRFLFNKPNEEGVVKVSGIISKGARGFIPLSLTLNFKNCEAKYMAPAENTLTLLESDGDTVKVRDSDDQASSGSQKPDFWYSTSRRVFLDNDTTADKVTDLGDSLQEVEYNVEYAERFSAMLKAVFDGSMNGDVITLPYNSSSFELSLAKLTGFDYSIDVISVDIREPKVTKKLGSICPESQLQLLKQAWNTTAEVENFWWVDRNHILELSSQYITLKRNTKRLHDWNGNIFEDVWKAPRSEVITGNVYKYFVPSAFEQSKTVFCALEPSVGAIKLKVYDIRKQFELIFECTIAPRHVDLGNELNAEGNISVNDVFLNTYSQLTAEMVLSKAEWSSTVVDDRLILGCHVSNNLNQWAIVIKIDGNSSFVEQVIQGYGYVGLHGELTGGMLPVDYFKCEAITDHGFNGTVYPLKDLDRQVNVDGTDKNVDKVFEINSPYEISELAPRIYGTAEQQWYVQKRLHGVVSHLLYVDKDNDDGSARQHSFVAEVVPITNNYESLYASPSFYSSVIGDCMVQVSPFADLFKFPAGLDTVWRMLCGFVSYPLLFNFAPRFSSLCYLQQSFGQYAYVHYNSSRNPAVKELEDTENVKNGFENGKKDVLPVLSSEFVFDKQKVIQKGSTELNYFASGPIALLISSFSEALQIIGNKQSINEEQNQSAIFDTGKKYLENVAENTANMLTSAVMSQSKNDFGLTSTVTGTKSLDMFYSTSDGQRVFAGPGYTEMQFVADCVAQSVTDTQVEGRVTQLFLNIKGLTTLQMELMLVIEDLIAQLMDKIAESQGLATVMGNNVGWAIRMATHIMAQAIRFSMAAQRVGIEQVNKVLDAFSARGVTASTDGHISRHALSVEGKHKYGEKNEVFMWPCWGVPAGQLKYSDESVACGVKNTPWELALHSTKYFTSTGTNWANIIVSCGVPNMSSNKANSTQVKSMADADQGHAGKPTVGGDNYRAYRHEGSVPFYQIAPYGKVVERILPDDMAKIEGVSRFLPSVPFKNENIGVSDPAFAPSLIHDYILDKNWQLGLCSSYGLRQWVTLRDTKVLNGPPSNIVIDGEFCGIASPYTAVEVKRGIKKAYMRPLAITPNVLALNCTGYNAVYDDDLYHAFDGMSCRLVDLVGSPGLNKAKQSFYYAIQVNDRFKRSNIIPAQEMLGNFETEPVVAMDTIDQLWTTLTVAMDEKGLEAGTVGEDKDAVRWSIPVFSEPVSTLPACVKTMTAATLAVVEGVTGLVTAQVTDTNSAYKAPTSVDFSIGKNVYRATEEYICSVTPAEAGNVITDIVPSLGLKFIGSTPTEAYFYSKATRCYYVFTGSNLVKVDMMERFRDIQRGYWDFVNQEVVMPCLMTFKRLNPDVEDVDTETDNVIVPVLSKGTVSGELPPPLTTIFNDRSWYKCLSLPSGFAYQGPNRVIINRAVFTEYMLETMKENLGKWNKVPREKYSFNREYAEKYDLVTNSVGVAEDGRKRGVSGWTHNPFLLVTSALGVAENTDCLFEWEITFCWPVEMDLLYGPDNYACVNIIGETMTPGGKREARPTHVFLTKELFTRNGSYGYYSFRYQSKNGSGNRERLKIWSDSYIAISSLTCECKVVTQRRSEQLTQQIDVRDLKEL